MRSIAKLALVVLAACDAAPDGVSTVAWAAESSVALGDCAVGHSVERVIRLRNPTGVRRTVYGLDKSCGCIAVRVGPDLKPIDPKTGLRHDLAPGATLDLGLTFRIDRAGAGGGTVAVHTTDPKLEQLRVVFTWRGVPQVVAEPQAFDFGTVEPGASREVAFALRALTAKPVRVESWTHVGITADLGLEPAADGLWHGTVRFPAEDSDINWTIRGDARDGLGPFGIAVKAQVRGPIASDPLRVIYFGGFTRGDAAEQLRVWHRHGKPLRVTASRIADTNRRAEDFELTMKRESETATVFSLLPSATCPPGPFSGYVEVDLAGQSGTGPVTRRWRFLGFVR